jgi:sulfite reductase alpha subunit-like flavoprotein
VDGRYSAAAPLLATVRDWRLLTAPTSDRRVLHVEVELAGSGATFAPGDSIAMLPENHPPTVDALLVRPCPLTLNSDERLEGGEHSYYARHHQKGFQFSAAQRRHTTRRERMGSPTLKTLKEPILKQPWVCFGYSCTPQACLGVDGSLVVTVSAAAGGGAEDVPRAALAPNVTDHTTVRHVLLTAVDLDSPPRKTLLRMLGEYTTEPAEHYALLNLCSRGGKMAYDVMIKDDPPTLLELLHKFPSCKPPLGTFP